MRSCKIENQYHILFLNANVSKTFKGEIAVQNAMKTVDVNQKEKTTTTKQRQQQQQKDVAKTIFMRFQEAMNNCVRLFSFASKIQTSALLNISK